MDSVLVFEQTQHGVMAMTMKQKAVSGDSAGKFSCFFREFVVQLCRAVYGRKKTYDMAMEERERERER